MNRTPAFSTLAAGAQDCVLPAVSQDVSRQTSALPRLRVPRLRRSPLAALGVAQAFREEGRSRAGAFRGYRVVSGFCLVPAALAGRFFRRSSKTLGNLHPADGCPA